MQGLAGIIADLRYKAFLGACMLSTVSRLRPAAASRSSQTKRFEICSRNTRRPVTLRDALRESVRMHPANEQTSATIHRLRRRLPDGPRLTNGPAALREANRERWRMFERT